MYLGIDLGGTNIAVGLVTKDGKIIKKDSQATNIEGGYKKVVFDMAGLCEKILDETNTNRNDIKGIGIGFPGATDVINGNLSYATNLNMVNVPIVDEMKKYFDVPVNILNDADAAALAEYKLNGDGVDSFVFITLGTGIGGGIIIDGKLYTSFNGIGTELGHITLIHNGIPCICGNSGCWERYASVSALIEQTKEMMKKNPDSLMIEISKKEGKVSGKTAFDAAKKGDLPAKEVVRQYCEYVASGLVSIINIFQPRKLVIGGGISKEGDYLLNPVKEYCKKHEYNQHMEKVDISIATLYNDAGIIGAALSCL